MSLRNERLEELEELVTTFGTPGFTRYAGDVQSLYEALIDSAVTDCDTGEKWMQRRGELLAIARIIGYTHNTEAELDNIDDMRFEDELPIESPGNPLED